jgi:hypothetical protein
MNTDKTSLENEIQPSILGAVSTRTFHFSDWVDGNLIDKIREIALHNLGLYIPDSEEYLINKFQIEKELSWVK